MDGRAKRTQRIIDRIKETTLQLFSIRDVEDVSMEEIAEKAGVSKITIYNHFHSKEALLQQVLELYSERVFAAAEEVLNSDLGFMEKLHTILLAQINRPQMASSDRLFALIEKDARSGGKIHARLKEIIFRFFEQGKQEGYIDETIPFELLYLYSEIYRAGYKAKLDEVEALVTNSQDRETMNDLFFWGILKRKG